MRYTCITILFLFFFSACQYEESPYFKTILKNEIGDFRGAHIGENINTIKALEDARFLWDKSYDYLHYDYAISMGNSYTITYDFSQQDELYEIEATVYLDDINDASLLFENFNSYFDKKYGNNTKTEDGFTTWNVKNAHHHLEFALKNDSVSYTIITIIIRDLDY